MIDTGQQALGRKIYGANIVCAACGAQPYPPFGSGFRETFDLLRVGASGKPSDSGQWCCELCPPRKRAARP